MSISLKSEVFEFFPRPPFSSGYKLTGDQKDLLWNLLQGDPGISSIELSQRFEAISGGMSVTLRHLNWIRVNWDFPANRVVPWGAGSFLLKFQEQWFMLSLTSFT